MAFRFSLLQQTWRNLSRGLHTLDQVLRCGRSGVPAMAGEREEDRRLPFRAVMAIVFAVGPLYGGAMGTYAAMVGQRAWWEQWPQIFFSATKVPLLILVTLGVSIPSFFVINSLFGLRDDFRESLRAIVSAQAGLTIVLASLSPLTLLVYVSLDGEGLSYTAAVMFNAVMFGLASVSAQLLLRRYYGRLIERDRRHRWMIRFWIVVYAFVGIQAGYVLRPFIGNPSEATTFFRHESFENAYVKVLKLIWGLWQG